MNATNEDVFFLSNGHISLYFMPAWAGPAILDLKELAIFRKLNSRLQGHPATAEDLPGIRIASGSPGRGMSVAIAKKLNHEKMWFFHCIETENRMKAGMGKPLCLRPS